MDLHLNKEQQKNAWQALNRQIAEHKQNIRWLEGIIKRNQDAEKLIEMCVDRINELNRRIEVLRSVKNAIPHKV